MQRNNLPIYDIVVDEATAEQGVGFISLVDAPAIEVDWVKLRSQEEMRFTAVPDKRLLYGPFLIPDILIYRNDPQMGEFYVKFSKDNIEKVSRKFQRDNHGNNINLMHSDTVVNATVVESWLTDTPDKSEKYGFKLPVGSWFGCVFIEDESFWTDFVKTDEVRGFSVEIKGKLTPQTEMKNKIQMQEETKLGAEAKLADGTVITTDGQGFTEGVTVMTVDAQGNAAPLPDGDYTLEDGSSITVANGKIAKAVVAPAPAAPVAQAATTGLSTEEPIVETVTPDPHLSAIQELNTLIKGLTEEVNSIKSKMTTTEEKVELLSKAPGAKSTLKNKGKAIEKMTRDEFALSLFEIGKSLHKK